MLPQRKQGYSELWLELFSLNVGEKGERERERETKSE